MWKPIFRPELHKNKEIEHFHDSQSTEMHSFATISPGTASYARAASRARSSRFCGFTCGYGRKIGAVTFPHPDDRQRRPWLTALSICAG